MTTIVVSSGSKEALFYMNDLLSKNTDFNIRPVEHNTKNKISKIKDILFADIVHILSVKLNGVEGFFWIFYFLFLRIFQKKIILHWIGTDVTEANKIISYICNKLVHKHFAQSPWLVTELQNIGIKATWALISSPPTNIHPNIPYELTVLVYLGNSGTEEFYGKSLVTKLAQNTPYKFIIVGHNKIEGLSNVTNVGWIKMVEMESLYAQSTVLLRLTKHDGFSHMVFESLQRGKYVIWTQPFPYCFYANDYDSAFSYLQYLRTVKSPNIDGKVYIERFNQKNMADFYKETYITLMKSNM